ncbi:MAG: hypothetical protein ACREQY_18730 [Candidatus Binatia bacterium]
MSAFRRRGPLGVTLLPWLIAAGSMAAAFVLRVHETPPPPEPAIDDSDRERELRELRLSLAASSSEAIALREELDRLLGLYQERLGIEPAASDPPSRPAAPDGAGDAETSPARLTALAEDYRDALTRSLAGDEAASDEAYEAVMRLVRAGPAAFPGLRDAYLSTSDPRARAVISRAFLTTMGGDAREFVAERLAAETDAELREELALRASRMTTPATATAFRDPLLGLLDSDAGATARAAAVRGLRYVRGDAKVDRGLLAAAADSAPEVRSAALDQLASRPGLHAQLRRLLAAEVDPEVRAAGQCRLLLANDPYPR